MNSPDPLSLLYQRKRPLFEIENALNPMSTQTNNLLDAGCSTIENMIREVQKEAKDLPEQRELSMEEVSELLEEHSRRIHECESAQKQLLQRFDDLSHLMSAFSHSSPTGFHNPVSSISVVPDESCNGTESRHAKNALPKKWQDSLTSPLDDAALVPPLVSVSDLPPLAHPPAEEGCLERWNGDNVDKLVTSVSRSLRQWIRERQQSLLLKRQLLLRCEERTRVLRWYEDEVQRLERYYYEQTNCIQKDLSDIRTLIDKKEVGDDSVRPVPKEKRESRMQMTSIPGPQIVSVAENGQDEEIALESGSTSGTNAGHASTHDRAETPSEGTVDSTKSMPANLRVYDMAINEAPHVIDQLGYDTVCQSRSLAPEIQSLATIAALPPPYPTLVALLLADTIQKAHNQDIFVLLEGKKTLNIAKLKCCVTNALLSARARWTTLSGRLPMIQAARLHMQGHIRQYEAQMTQSMDQFLDRIADDIILGIAEEV